MGGRLRRVVVVRRIVRVVRGGERSSAYPPSLCIERCWVGPGCIVTSVSWCLLLVAFPHRLTLRSWMSSSSEMSALRSCLHI